MLQLPMIEPLMPAPHESIVLLLDSLELVELLFKTLADTVLTGLPTFLCLAHALPL